MTLRLAQSSELGAATLASLRSLWDDAFADRFDDHDADHAMGGTHALIEESGVVVSHGSVVPREILVGDRVYAVGYVEGVATAPDRQGAGLGTLVMEALDRVLRREYELGVLSTGRATTFYERLGWERWRGLSYTLTADGHRQPDDEHGGLMVLRFGSSEAIDLAADITCHDRPGDAW